MVAVLNSVLQKQFTIQVQFLVVLLVVIKIGSNRGSSFLVMLRVIVLGSEF